MMATTPIPAPIAKPFRVPFFRPGSAMRTARFWFYLSNQSIDQTAKISCLTNDFRETNIPAARERIDQNGRRV
jgi:hypothetical protein